MKNVDPKIMTIVLVVIIVGALVWALRSAGIGRDSTPPPIAAGGPAAGSGAAVAAGPTGTPRLTLPGNPPATPGGGVPPPLAAGGMGTGPMTLPTPPPGNR